MTGAPDKWEMSRVWQVVAARAKMELEPDQYLKLTNIVEATIDDYLAGKLFSVKERTSCPHLTK